MKPIVGEIVRFGIVGITCTILHYALYYAMLFFINVNIAHGIGYVDIDEE